MAYNLSYTQSMNQVQERQLPGVFAINMRHPDGRNGYIFIQSLLQANDAEGRRVYRLRRQVHHGLYYNAVRLTDGELANNEYQAVQTLKPSGNMARRMRWKYGRHAMVNTGAGLRYPLLVITPFAVLPVMDQSNFIPIVDPPVAATVPIVPAIRPRYTIKDIPQHALRLMLQGAVMLEEICPITGEEIDISNGAITTCFHLFERNAIATWLAMPSSKNSCPVCKVACDSYSLDEPPPLDMSG